MNAIDSKGVLTGLAARDGFELGVTVFEPAFPERASKTVIIHGAVATPQRFYREFAEELASTGLRVVTYDYRGVGASRRGSLRGFDATMMDWAELDARAVHQFVESQFPGQPFAIVGHSFGGQLIGLLDEARDAAGALLVGAQLGYYGNFRAPVRLGLEVLWHAVPLFTAAFGYLPGRIGAGVDLPRGVAEEWARWCRTEEYYLAEHPEARTRLASYDRPVRVYRFTDDEFAPRRAVEALTSRLGNGAIDVRRVSPSEHEGDAIGHFGFFRPRFRETLWREAASFLHAVLEGRAPANPLDSRPGAFGIRQSDVMTDLTRHGWG